MPFVFLTQFLHIDIYGEKKEKNDAQQKAGGPLVPLLDVDDQLGGVELRAESQMAGTHR